MTVASTGSETLGDALHRQRLRHRADRLDFRRELRTVRQALDDRVVAP